MEAYRRKLTAETFLQEDVARLRSQLAALPETERTPEFTSTIETLFARLNDAEWIATEVGRLEQEALLIANERLFLGDAQVTRESLPRWALLKAMYQRGRRYGFTRVPRMGDMVSEADFAKALAQGPFLDQAFRNSDHGMETHWVQLSICLDTIAATYGDPAGVRSFFETLGRSPNVWYDTFDRRAGLGTAAEDFGRALRAVLPLE